MIRMSFQLPSNDTHELVGLRGRRQSNMVSSNEYNQVKIAITFFSTNWKLGSLGRALLGLEKKLSRRDNILRRAILFKSNFNSALEAPAKIRPALT